MSMLKQLGDNALKGGDIRQSIDLYTRALLEQPTNEILAVEQKREILANRVVAYIKYGDIYDALQDCDLALSPEYTTAVSPKVLTAKCRIRRANLHYKMTLYEEAKSDYQEFSRLYQEEGRAFSRIDKKVLEDIEEALRIPPRSAAMRKIKLIRAVQARRILLEDRFHANFPKHPHLNRQERTRFEGAIGSDLAQTPLHILFAVRAPNLEDPSGPAGACYQSLCEMLEEVTVGDFIQSIFFSYGISAGAAHGRDWLRRFMTLADPDASQVLLVTHRARILRIPSSTRIGDIWAGAKWPRQSPLAFKDLRSTSRQRPHEIDGASFNKGFTVDLHVLRNEEIPAYVQRIESDFGASGM